MRLGTKVFGALLSCWLVCVGGNAWAGIVFVCSGGTVGRVDVDTGQVFDTRFFSTVVNNGSVQFNEGGFTDIAFAPTGDLYGITPYSLWKIDYEAGLNSRVAAMTGGNLVGIPNALTFGTDGTLYIGAALSTVVHTMNVETAVRTSLNNQPLPGGSYGDLAFIGDDLFMSGLNGLHKYDLSTSPPTATTVGNPLVNNLYGLASPDRVNLYGFASNSIYKIDPIDGRATFHKLLNGPSAILGIDGAAFQTESISAVPEPSTFLLVSGAGLVMLLRRNKLLPGRLS